MLKNWTQTIYLMLSCGAMLVGATVWLTSTIATSTETQRAYAASVAASDRDLIDALRQEMTERVTKVEERQRFDDAQMVQSQASVDRLTVSLSELTKELSNLEGVIADGRKR